MGLTKDRADTAIAVFIKATAVPALTFRLPFVGNDYVVW